MAKVDRKEPLRVSVYGMDARTLATFKLFLRGPCGNRAVAVSDRSAEVSVVDLDGPDSPKWFARERESFPDRPMITMSVNRPLVPGTIFVPKPIKAAPMVSALEEARAKLNANTSNGDALNPSMSGQGRDQIQGAATIPPQASPHRRRSTHKTAMLLDENAYSSFVGVVPDIDLLDPLQVANAYYDKKKYLQAYVQSAVKLARSRNRILQLHCGWKPIIIFPHSNEIWIDADDRQIRAFCVVPMSSISDIDLTGKRENSRPIISAVAPDQVALNNDPRNFQSIDAFIWKIALWTSNGRIPKGIDLHRPVYLKYWPNLSRLVVIPHSLRIVALLINQPMTLGEVAETLQIEQQYVFSFFSAAKALGLAGQSTRQADMINLEPRLARPPRTGLLRKILNRLKVV